MKGSTNPLTDTPAKSAIEVLYESSTTRVFRDGPASASVVCKEPLGADAAQRLRHEESMLARLDGLAGVAQLAAGSHPNGMLVLQDSRGGTLAELLRAGPIPQDALLTMAAQLTQSVAAVHRAGVIHRDINPSNILVSGSSEPVLIDFDLAAPADQLARSGHHDGIVGTLGYLAPEQTGRTGHPVDQRSDLYALGATLYEMATARPPFEGADTLQLIHDHLVHEPLAPIMRNAQLPKTLSDILLRLLAKAPEQRYQSAEGLLHDLQRLQDELPVGGDGSFALGERDFPARLAPPQQLVGRSEELSMLRNALADALHTPRRLVLLEGPAGVGKSALINELRPLVAAAGGWFVQGKFDQYQKDGATLGALTQALQMLGRLLLAQPRDELAGQRQRIIDSLGRNAGMMTRLLPEFALLLGPQPEVTEIDPRQAELQLHEATVALLSAIASPERPIVVVLDDLQWTGILSLRTIERLRSEPSLRGLLIVGAYRGGDGDGGDVLAPMLAQWRQQPQAPAEITLANLAAEETGELIGHMLRLERPAANRLANAIGALTDGNAFDTVELINALRRDGVLSLGRSGWQWDEEAITHFIGRGNVVDLLAARIARLPPPARELLEYMSCLGNTIECRLLGAATGLGEAELQQLLRAPLEDGLLQAEGNGQQQSVHFRHDRVQQAVLATMDDAQRGQRQLAMARRLAAGFGFDDIAAQQYLACAPLLGDAAEQRRAAHLFYSLAQKLAGMASYALAERYLASASALLAAVDDAADTALRGAIDARRHAALYSLGRLDDADECYLAMKQRTADMLDQVDPACLQMRSLDMRGRSEDAMKLGLGMLAQLGLHVPADYAASDTGQRLDALGEWVRQDSLLDHRTRPQIRDRRLLAIVKLLGRTVRSAFVRFDTRALVWLLLESQRLWADHGPCPELVAYLGRLSGMLITLRQDYHGAHSIASHVLTVGEALQYEPQTAEARFIYATYTSHWFEPLEEAFPELTRAYERVRAGGDASFACYVHLVLFTVLVEIAPTIEVTLSELDDGISLCNRTGNVHAAALHTSLRQTLRALGGLTRPSGSFDDAQYNEQAFLQRMGKLPFVENSCALCIAMHALIMGETGELARTADRGMATLDNLAGYYMTAYAHFFVAMARALEVQADPSGAQRAAHLAQLESCRAWLAGRATDQPYNYLHLLRLVEAEQAWAMGDLWKATTSFNTAVNEAESRRRPWHRAVITERAGLFNLAQGMTRAGRQLITEARDIYEAWGAKAKVARMTREHEFLHIEVANPEPRASLSIGHSLRGSMNGASSDALDLVGVLRASQALSSETSLERLNAGVTDVLAALSGATKVLVLSWNGDQWWLLAPAPGQARIPVPEAAARGLLPLSAFGYAERTGEALMVDDAPGDDRFARDPYFAGVPLCSLLLVPIAGQGSSRAMLLLENRLSRAAFNAQRLDAVMLIAGQLAVSLANAQLYEGLEERVQARTRELEQTQAQLVATARRAGKAEIANNVLHNVGNVLNSVNVSASVVRRTLNESRSQGLARAVALMNEHEHDLAGFMGHDPRGKTLLGYLNELVGALGAERQNALGDLDRLSRSVAHITYVVATQQSHAGPSSVLENVQPEELLEEALQMSADVLLRCHVNVVRHYGNVPASPLDRQRLLQILVNLIGNAAQAMEGTPELARQLTLTTSVVRNGNGTRLRITVQDEGEGIAPENLTRIFAHGFTTRQGGHGFGLHSASLAAMEIGAKLSAHSDGVGRGAVFSLEVPGKVQEHGA